MTITHSFPVSAMIDSLTLRLGDYYSNAIKRSVNCGQFYLGRQNYSDGWIKATPLLVRGSDNKVSSLSGQDLKTFEKIPILCISGISSHLTYKVKRGLLDYLGDKRKDYLYNYPKDNDGVSLIKDLQLQIDVDDNPLTLDHFVKENRYCSGGLTCEMLLNYPPNRIEDVRLVKNGISPLFMEVGIQVMPDVIFEDYQ